MTKLNSKGQKESQQFNPKYDFSSTIKSNSERVVKIKNKNHLFCKECRKKKKYKVRLENRYRKQVGKKIMILWI